MSDIVDTTIPQAVPDAILTPAPEPILAPELAVKGKKATSSAQPEGVAELQTLIDQIVSDPGPVMTIDKFLDQDNMGWEESHRLAWIQYHSRKFLTAPEWKRILTIDSNTRA